MKNLFRSTPGEKIGSIDGLNLFFGALLGANLGTMQTLPLLEYVELVVVLAGSVMVLRMISTSERRAYVFGALALYIFIIGSMLLLPALQPKGIALGDLHRLVATLAIWVTSVVVVELTPTREVRRNKIE